MSAPLSRSAPLGIYLHVPFCTRLCPYCDFNKYIHQEHLIPAYIDALLKEIELTRAEIGPVAASTINFGGGTPSLLPPDGVAQIINALHERFDLTGDIEVTLEANPEGLTAERLAGYREAGVNRLSIGVQTQQAPGLKVLGRAHKPHVPEQALQTARAAGFDDINVDFIFGWPGQTLEQWSADLDTMIAWGTEHISLYSLIVEPGTPYYGAVQRGILTPVDDDTTADMYELAIERLAEAGWRHYEVSNWARSAGLEARHNAIYWRNGQYLGLGAGAHAHLNGTRSSNIRPTQQYISAVERGEHHRDFQETIDEPTAMAETMMLGLRLVCEGVSAAAFEIRHGRTLQQVYGREIDALVASGLLEWDGQSVRLTRRGLLLANEVAERFLPDPVR